MKKFNINEYMYIQITEDGWKHLRKTVGEDYIKHCIEPRKVVVNNETWYKLQCHNAFSLFPMNGSFHPSFKSNVMFDSEALDSVDQKL